MELAAVLGFLEFGFSRKGRVRIELIGQDLFKYEGDRIEKVGAKDWMEPLMKKTDWDQCMAAKDHSKVGAANGL